jgi:hypothetical protein
MAAFEDWSIQPAIERQREARMSVPEPVTKIRARMKAMINKISDNHVSEAMEFLSTVISTQAPIGDVPSLRASGLRLPVHEAMRDDEPKASGTSVPYKRARRARGDLPAQIKAQAIKRKAGAYEEPSRATRVAATEDISH